MIQIPWTSIRNAKPQKTGEQLGEKKNCQSRILYQMNISFNNKVKKKTLLDYRKAKGICQQ